MKLGLLCIYPGPMYPNYRAPGTFFPCTIFFSGQSHLVTVTPKFVFLTCLSFPDLLLYFLGDFCLPEPTSGVCICSTFGICCLCIADFNSVPLTSLRSQLAAVLRLSIPLWPPDGHEAVSSTYKQCLGLLLLLLFCHCRH